MYKFMLILLVLVGTMGCAVWAADAPAQSPESALPKTKINPKDGAEMILIPAGEFLMGNSNEQIDAWIQIHSNEIKAWYKNEIPQHKVYLDAYYIYKNDITVAQYRKFCDATGRKLPLAPPWGWLDNHPVVNVTWNDATAYAHWSGASLPTEAQWEKSARGGDGRVFPWGNAWDATKCNNSVGNLHPDKTSPVGSFPAAASPYGVLDISGNVAQWCADWYDDKYNQNSPSRNPTGPTTGSKRVTRGGGFYGPSATVFRVARRSWFDPAGENSYIGFRCVVSLPTP